MEFRLLTADEIEVKVKQVTEKGAVALLYKNVRTDMALLDETVGAENWQDDYREVKGNLYCGIGIWFGSERGYVWKWNCGTESREDGEGNEKKGEASDAFKRAGTTWGIGRELYTAPFIFLNVETKEKNGKYILADKFQTFEVAEITHEGRNIKSVRIVDNHGNVVFGGTRSGNAKRANNTPTEDPPVTPPKSGQNQAKATTAAPTPVTPAASRKATIQAHMKAVGCPNDPVILFMSAANKKTFDELDEKQYDDLLKMVKAYGKS